VSLTAMSECPASLRLATTFDPMKPAPPVTNNIDVVTPHEVAVVPVCPSLNPDATLVA
jgi:hypothetical protein